MPATLRSVGYFIMGRIQVLLPHGPHLLRSVYLQSGGKVQQWCTMAYFFLTGNPCNAHIVSILQNCQRDRRTGCLIGSEVGPRESGQRRV